ncbi:DUF294 nucleotidyltransferase-like domain-containing protein [Robertmurraya massiliosenegalensis]|uniref:DUF294 nucleotidyltransferase-like domain-containing protein n=1 Tax=Robertmurraya TaxID=2837507 RepID=UPI0039A4956F
MMENQNKDKKLLEAVQSHPFFHGVEVGTALSLLKDCQFKQYDKNEILLYKDKQREGLILILEGFVEVYVENEVLEVVQKGEMLGFSSMADFLGVPHRTKDEVTVESRARSIVKVLYIPFQVIARRWEDPNVRDYLLTQVAVRLRDVYGSLTEQVHLAREFGEKEVFMLRVQDIMTDKVVAIDSQATIIEAAKKMNDHHTSSILVMGEGSLNGIITERDIVGRVVAKGIPLTHSVSRIMTKNPITISRFAYYYDAIGLIFTNGIKHLPVIEDGETVGIVTLSDLLRKKNENVMKTIKQIEEVDEKGLPNVKKAVYSIVDTLLQENIPMDKTLGMITNLYDRLVVRIINLAVEGLEKKGYEQPGDFAFYQMGSSGRGEQFMLTDQDHFLVYETDENEYFQRLGTEITRLMEFAGYARCKGLMMCSEKKWRGNLLDWEDRLRTWSLQSTRENLLLAQNFFSSRFIAGSKDVDEQLEKIVLAMLGKSKIFLYRLAQAEREHLIPTLEHPIRSLFRLEKKSIDMKKAILFPYHHSLQILSLLHGIPSGIPFAKIDALEAKGAFSKNFAQDLREAGNQLLALYVRQRWKQQGSSIVQFTRMTTREKEEMLLSLKTIKELQSIVFSRFSI